MAWRGEFDWSVKGNYVLSKISTINPIVIPAIWKERLESATDAQKRHLAGQAFLNWIARQYKLPKVTLTIVDIPRPKMKGFEYHGIYYPSAEAIRIYNRTAVKRDIISSGRFIETLLHEFTHHFDTYGLHIESIHTSGFYKRLSVLKDCFYNNH